MNIESFIHRSIIALSILTILFSTSILIFIFVYIRPIKTNIPIILTCNTYVSLILCATSAIFIHVHESLDDHLCRLKAYFLYAFACVFYYSCVLQASFRLFRVVFHQNKKLHSLTIFIIGILTEWIFSLLYVFTHYIFNDFEYIPLSYGCWISFNNIRAIGTAFLVMYLLPLIIICSMYFFIIRHVHQTARFRRLHRLANRNLLVLKRILMTVTVAIGLGLPTGVMLINHIFTKRLPSLAYQIQEISGLIGLLMESIVFAFVAPQVQ